MDASGTEPTEPTGLTAAQRLAIALGTATSPDHVSDEDDAPPQAPAAERLGTSARQVARKRPAPPS